MGFKLTSGLCLLLATPVFASTINVDFAVPDAPFSQGVSTSAKYTFAPSDQIVATGYHVNSDASISMIGLFAKTGPASGDERGLGLTSLYGGSDHEITVGNFIQLDLSKLTSFGATSFTVKTNSTTGDDAFALALSATKGMPGVPSIFGNTETTYSFTAAQIAATPYISLGATKGDVLLGPAVITSAPTPEPGTILSLGTGLALVALGFRKKLRS